MEIIREAYSLYYTVYPKDRKGSPYKIAIDVCRFTNSKTWGKGMSRLEDIAEQLRDEHIDPDEVSSYLENEGYEGDIGEPTQRLNAIVEYVVERITDSGTDEIDRGTMKY